MMVPISALAEGWLIFEAISWLAARQVYPGVLLKTPHVSATSQGLDGLMIELKTEALGRARPRPRYFQPVICSTG
jgi:hypothetical protein